MISRIEHIGQPSQSSWLKRFRRWLHDLLGSSYAQLLERDLMQARLERDRAQSELKATQERLIEVLAASKGIPWRPVIPAETNATKPASVPATRWQQIQAEAIAENARREAEDAENADKVRAQARTEEN
jgi:vacuolar-type H+-ATPase subunit I/STV1